MEKYSERSFLIKKSVLIAFICTSIFFISIPVYMTRADNNEEYTRLESLYNDYIIMPETLVYKIRQKANDYVLYDLRNPEDYSKYHVIGAKNLPWDSIEKGINTNSLPHDKKIILISSDGFYSLKAIDLLLNSGYSSVYSIEGGMNNWPYKKLLIK